MQIKQCEHKTYVDEYFTLTAALHSSTLAEWIGTYLSWLDPANSTCLNTFMVTHKTWIDKDWIIEFSWHLQI